MPLIGTLDVFFISQNQFNVVWGKHSTTSKVHLVYIRSSAKKSETCLMKIKETNRVDMPNLRHLQIRLPLYLNMDNTIEVICAVLRC